MMQQMRENTKWIMLITALAFVALMVFEWGMDMSGQSAGAVTGGRLGTVNGTPINYDEYSRVYRSLYEQRQQSGDPISASENREIEEQAFEQLVIQRLIAQELARRDIEVSDAEIRQAARYAPPPEFMNNEMFQTDGQFDLDKYHEFMGSPAADPRLLADLESYYRGMIPRNKLIQQVSASIVVTDGELWRMYKEQNETASIRFVLLDPRRLVGDAEVTIEDREVAAYYDRHREDFQRPARASVQAVAVDKRPTAADTAAARARAQEVLAQIREGQDFADVAARESDDEATAGRGGDLGTIRRGQMVPAFEEAVWDAPIGEVTGPVATRFGYHLIRVDSRTDSIAETAHILLPIERTIDSEDAMLAQVDSLEAMVERLPLEAAAEELGLRVRTAELTPLLPNVPGVGTVSEGVDWAFEQDPLVGDVSPVFENDRSFYLFELIEREEERTLTLDEARESIEQILRTERKRERTRDMGRQLIDALQAGAALDQAAAAMGLPVEEAGPFTRIDFVPGLGRANAAIGAAFGLEIGEVSGLIETADAFYVIETTDRTEADREAWEAQLPQQRQQVAAALQNQRISEFLDALRQEADVKDNRDEVLTGA